MSRLLPLYQDALENPNVRAFLEVIARGETVAQDDQAYRWLFGSTKSKPKLFDHFDDHPRIYTKEEYDGQFIKNGKIDQTSAAGKYQIVASTWDTTVKGRIGKTDFSPTNQDLAAVALIDFRGALPDVIAGRIESAIDKCRNEWASLPNSPYGQPTQKMSDALAAFVKYGGTLAGTVPAKAPTPAPVPAPAPAPVPRPTWTPAGEAPDYGTQSEKPMTPLLTGLATSLINIFTPIAREKITKELARHSDNPDVVEQITSNVIEAAKAVTKQSDPIVAVSEVIKTPELAQAVENDSMANLTAMTPLLDKLFEIEKSTWSAEEESRDAAADRPGVLAENDMGVFLMRSGMIAIGALFALVGGMIITQLVKVGEADTQSWAALTGLIGWVTAKVGSIFDYRFGSSRTSGAKDVIISKMVDKQAQQR